MISLDYVTEHAPEVGYYEWNWRLGRLFCTAQVFRGSCSNIGVAIELRGEHYWHPYFSLDLGWASITAGWRW